MALGATVEGSSAIHVSKMGGRYSVSMDGELGAGVFLDFGIRVMNVGMDAFASGVLSRGTKYELSFATAEEAKKAVGLMLSRVGKKATGRKLTADEQELFQKNLAAVELTGALAASGWTMLGLPSVFSAIAEGLATVAHTVRIELEAMRKDVDYEHRKKAKAPV